MDANGASGGVLRVGVPILKNARGKGWADSWLFVFSSTEE